MLKRFLSTVSKQQKEKRKSVGDGALNTQNHKQTAVTFSAGTFFFAIPFFLCEKEA